MRFPTKITWSCIWVWLSYFLYACGADGRSGRRANGHVITKISRLGRLTNFPTHGALLRALGERGAPLKPYIVLLSTLSTWCACPLGQERGEKRGTCGTGTLNKQTCF